ncbi:aminomethyl-transferring glycine dehydrogenase subunit GcvPB [Chloroflexus sp.]|uniref:aminomethyl-transferring glycine dehydrogenase subunit GcvPB n=1 Tax=Chloroflexus sp. TaxID=1904827 RepID=UPI00298F1316|nr:aminomethyl-transferring glycine dehydrogenase subunit GcvPB [Chloroflexus sp.]MCS6888295.1 aminomethyl-transferring glycine dehydrogenase subunit GcvPB [Chloroflexus sp.]MDW8405238.1 aminomethyl-transferring glycine dehydrogenase subunit GcvPB [Chloroflexus sp.]
MNNEEPPIFTYSQPGKIGVNLPAAGVETTPLPTELLRQDDLAGFPELTEPEVIRHFTRISQRNYSIDTGFYPLGSCTMKYNPKLHEEAARLPGFAAAHPLQDEELSQGALQLMYELQTYLGEISGFDAVSLQPAAGAQGELTGILVFRAYHLDRGDTQRTEVLVPDSAHGTNPATAAMVGLKVIELKSDARGNVDLADLKAKLSPRTAGMMLTNPNTLGLFEEHIVEICRLVHEAGGLMYGDGANFNAILGIAKPGELGFDFMHYNLHKTFTTPHGGGGPGSGAVGCTAALAPYLPGPRVRRRDDGRYEFFTPEKSIGRMKAFHGNFGMLVRAWTYIRSMGATGLRAVSETAVLNANYVRVMLKDIYPQAIDRICMHEVVLRGQIAGAPKDVRTLDIAKRLIDYGFHPPTIYFPLIVPEALMIEPTETESKQTLDHFIATMRRIAAEAVETPEVLHAAPTKAPVRRLDEVRAARQPILRYDAAAIARLQSE